MSKINNSIESLESNFRRKIEAFLLEVTTKYPNVDIFEALRSKERQQELYSIGRRGIAGEKPVTWTLQSKHLEGKAVDLIFKDIKGNPTWNGDYLYLIEVAKKYGIKNLAPKDTCHFECDGTPYKAITGYELQYKNKYGDNGTIYKDLSAIDKLIEEGDMKDLIYFILIGLERIKK